MSSDTRETRLSESQPEGYAGAATSPETQAGITESDHQYQDSTSDGQQERGDGDRGFRSQQSNNYADHQSGQEDDRQGGRTRTRVETLMDDLSISDDIILRQTLSNNGLHKLANTLFTQNERLVEAHRRQARRIGALEEENKALEKEATALRVSVASLQSRLVARETTTDTSATAMPSGTANPRKRQHQDVRDDSVSKDTWHMSLSSPVQLPQPGLPPTPATVSRPQTQSAPSRSRFGVFYLTIGPDGTEQVKVKSLDMVAPSVIGHLKAAMARWEPKSEKLFKTTVVQKMAKNVVQCVDRCMNKKRSDFVVEAGVVHGHLACLYCTTNKGPCCHRYAGHRLYDIVLSPLHASVRGHCAPDEVGYYIMPADESILVGNQGHWAKDKKVDTMGTYPEE